MWIPGVSTIDIGAIFRRPTPTTPALARPYLNTLQDLPNRLAYRSMSYETRSVVTAQQVALARRTAKGRSNPFTATDKQRAIQFVDKD